MARTMTHDRDGTLLDRLLTRLENWGRGEDLSRMSPDDLRTLAHDVGLDAGDLVRLASTETDASRLLYSRLATLGLDMATIEALGVGSQRDMERTCGLCPDRALCEHDLAERPESGHWRKVCPNSWTIDEAERRLQAKK